MSIVSSASGSGSMEESASVGVGMGITSIVSSGTVGCAGNEA